MSGIHEALDVVGIGALNIDYVATRSALSGIDAGFVGEFRQRFEYGSERPATRDEVTEILRTQKVVFETCLGGSAFNVIQTMANMTPSFRLGFIGIAGAPRSEPHEEPSFSAWFKRHRIDARFVEPAADPPGTCISYIDDGKRSLLTYPGANVQIGEMLSRRKDELVELLARTRVVHVTSLFDDKSPPALAEVLAAAKRRNPWLVVSFDPGHHWSRTRPKGFAEILALADYVFLNSREFKFLGEHRVADKDEDVAKRIFRSCGERTLGVILKRYDCISVFARLDNRLLEMEYSNVVLEPDQIEDATGTGDIFAAGMLASRVLPWFELRHGVALGLRLVHQKLRVGANKNIALVARTFDDVIEEVVLERGHKNGHEAEHPARPTAPPASGVTYSHSPGFRSFRVGEVEYSLSATQGEVVRELLDAWRRGVPDVAQVSLLQRITSEAERLHDLFRRSQAWNSLVITGKTKGTYRLALPTGARCEASTNGD